MEENFDIERYLDSIGGLIELYLKTDDYKSAFNLLIDITKNISPKSRKFLELIKEKEKEKESLEKFEEKKNK